MRSDPVCKTTVDEKNTINKTSYQGKDYYFCSTECQAQFQTNPESFGMEGMSGPTESRQGERKESSTTEGQTFSQQAGKTVGQVKSMAKDMKEKATERSKSILESRKNDAAGRLEGTAKVFRQTAKNFQGENPTVSRYADQIADRIEGASKYLREKDVKELVGDTERFIRKQPALFFGAAFAMGIIAARFLKSSRQNAGMYE